MATSSIIHLPLDHLVQGVQRPPASQRQFSFHKETLRSYTGNDDHYDVETDPIVILQINDGVLSAVPFPTACLQLMVTKYCETKK